MNALTSVRLFLFFLGTGILLTLLWGGAFVISDFYLRPGWLIPIVLTAAPLGYFGIGCVIEAFDPGELALTISQWTERKDR